MSELVEAMRLRAEVLEAVERYAAEVQRITNENFAKNFPNLPVPTVTVEAHPNAKYARVWKVGGQKCIHTFVALVDVDTKTIKAKRGDILKAETWKKPAKHPRGNVFNENPLEGVNEYGANYLR